MRNTQCRNPITLLAINLLHLSFALHLIISIAVADNLFINCGYPSNITNYGRNWTTDVNSNFIFSAHPNTSTTSEASNQGQIPYTTARLFYSQLTYSLPISPGSKFIRFYFYPISYPGLDDITKSFFSVSVSNFTLLHNFSASLTANYLMHEYFTKEFCVNIEGHILNITFTPTSSNPSINGFVGGFINGIEIVSMPLDLYIPEKGIPIVGIKHYPFYLDKYTALEMVYRLNVGGNEIIPNEDTSSLFRTWSPDDNYLFGAATGVEYYNLTVEIRYPSTVPIYTAPEIVYRSYRSMGPTPAINAQYNLTWMFSVDSGFYYLLRLHFCEIGYWITKVNERVFYIFIANETANDEMDVFHYSGGNGVPMYMDYIVSMGSSSGRKLDLWLALHPAIHEKPRWYDAFLNGLEIFKLNQTSGNLAGVNFPPTQLVQGSTKLPLREHQHNWVVHLVIIIVGAIVSVFLVTLGLVIFFITCVRRNAKAKSRVSKKTNRCRRFTFAEIIAATENFDEAHVIGIGGFGRVYKGHIDGGATTVAVKRGNATSAQGAREFQTEIEMLSNLRHNNLVSLIGFCQEGEELILVYDYMVHGTLREHLYSTHGHNLPLTWKQRLRICIGVARGLEYLHSGAEHTIIHRDMKTTNILLDEKWGAKVSDFGLSKLGPMDLSQSHVSTQVKGTHGYIDPEYFQIHQITVKSDVYSFGVVLFEVLCGRPPVVIRQVDAEQVYLPDWAAQCYRKGTLNQIVDPFLRGKIASNSLKSYGEIAVKCVAEWGIERPTMSEVLWYLEFALQLQETADEDNIAVETEGNLEMMVSGAGNSDGGGGGNSYSMCDWRRASNTNSVKILRRSSSDTTADRRRKMSMASG
ncbi:receptor-like protein kinase FERONIA [Macadamia integrifolia]|uniref:receptor-like protein kinase FERONIA n=1 Tax=Macadamia integrifolia TaxID=60698 RepID=UPI001C4EF6AD|nr:receptor-like protein kinase FERONIA [Macadamia integrifolia]